MLEDYKKSNFFYTAVLFNDTVSFHVYILYVYTSLSVLLEQ